MPRYIHKPTVVDAEQYNGAGSLSQKFNEALCTGPCEFGGVKYRNGERLPHIDTLHGPVQVELGDYIVPEVLHPGRFYPVRREEFEARYEPSP